MTKPENLIDEKLTHGEIILEESVNKQEGDIFNLVITISSQLKRRAS
jgi:hypothetical protein